MTEPLTIDGSVGEGGGQMLRSSLSLSMVTGRPLIMVNIRSKRKKPGLRRQHLTALRAAAEVSSAEVSGDEIGSTAITFAPGEPRSGRYHFSVGTAGSTTLVIQTVLPALLTGQGTTHLTVEGGTHNIFAPPFAFLQHAFLPLLARMGVETQATLVKPGFAPAGGGRIELRITPPPRLREFHLLERGRVRTRLATAEVAHLDLGIAERELAVVGKKLGWKRRELQALTIEDSDGPGNLITLRIESENVTEVFTGFGAIRKRAEAVANDAVKQARRYLAAEVPVGPYLADQLLLPLALAGGGSFRTSALTLHTETNIDIVERFLPVRFAVEEEPDRKDASVLVAVAQNP